MPSKLLRDQWQFSKCVGMLLLYAPFLGYRISIADAQSKEKYGAHRRNSFHYKKLAIDLDLFLPDGTWLEDTADHKELGRFWESLDPKCSWGGRWQDGNHYSWGEGRKTKGMITT